MVQFDAWNWEDAVVNIDEGLHMNWPKYRKINGSDKKYFDTLDILSDFFE